MAMEFFIHVRLINYVIQPVTYGKIVSNISLIKPQLNMNLVLLKY